MFYLATYFMSCQISFSQTIKDFSKEELINSNYYQSKKAEIRYINIGNKTVREIFIGGLKVNDLDLVRTAGNKNLYNELNSKVFDRSISSLSSIIISIPIGVGFLYTSSINRNLNSNSTDFKFFVLSTIGSAFILYSIVNSIMFTSEVSGLTPVFLLSNSQSEEIVKTYNESLIKNLLDKNKNSYNENLYYYNNNIMILSVEKFF